MILCVDITALKTSPDVQRDVNLEDILNNHTKYYDTEVEAQKDHHVPLNFCVSVRSMYSNLVLQTNTGLDKKYYTNLTVKQPFVHKGYDLIMYLSSIGLMHCIDYRLGFDDLMMKHSQFCPIGLYNSNMPYTSPIIYSHIIISDEGAEELKNYLKSDRELVFIDNIEPRGNIPALLNTFIEVKEVKNNE